MRHKTREREAIGRLDGCTMDENVLLPVDVHDSSPSRLDGISSPLESRHRYFGCNLIVEACIRLHLPQGAASTAQNILHRYYFRVSLARFDAFTVAMGCVLLAAKLEEKQKLLREVLVVFHDMFLKRKELSADIPFKIGGERYTAWKNELIVVERHLLKELGFGLYSVMHHPHQYILYFIKILDGDRQLAQRSWNYLNDCYATDICIHFSNATIAVAAIHLAATDLSQALPNDWWRLVASDFGVILLLIEEIKSVYDMERLQWCEAFFPVDYLMLGVKPGILSPESSPERNEESGRSDERPKERNRSREREKKRSRSREYRRHRSESRDRKKRRSRSRSRRSRSRDRHNSRHERRR